MKQYLISEADREYLMGHLSGKPWNILRELKPITKSQAWAALAEFYGWDAESVLSMESVATIEAERDALHAEIAKMREQEPVMFAYQYDDGTWNDASHTMHSCGMKPLYAAPGAQPTQHDSDCATHNMPAYPAGPCDCSVSNGVKP